jgi:hypothetical protein
VGERQDLSPEVAFDLFGVVAEALDELKGLVGRESVGKEQAQKSLVAADYRAWRLTSTMKRTLTVDAGGPATRAQSRSVTRRSPRGFARHFAEMIVVMLLGMGVLEGLAALAFAAAGSSLSDQPGAVRVLLMGLSMTVPMILWMRHCGHSTRRNVEMAASMVLPSLLAAALTAAGVLAVGTAFAVQHAVMIPAMLGVMLWRYDEYARPHTTSAPRGR